MGIREKSRPPGERAGLKVLAEQIKANGYNLNINNPSTVAAELGYPEELLAEYKMLLVSVSETQEKLKRELMDALGGTS